MLMWLVMNSGIYRTGAAVPGVSLPVGLLAWWLLLHLERRYEKHGFSNVQLVVDAWWAIVVASHLVSQWSDGAATALWVSGAAFAIYWITVRAGLRAPGLGTRAGGPTMLFLESSASRSALNGCSPRSRTLAL